MADTQTDTTVAAVENEPAIDFRDVIPEDNFEVVTEAPSTDVTSTTPDATKPAAVGETQTPESQPAGDVPIPSAGSTVAKGSDDKSGISPAEEEWPDELLRAEGFDKQRAMQVFGTPDRFEQAVLTRDRQIVQMARQAALMQQRQQAPPVQQTGRMAGPPPQQAPAAGQPLGGVPKYELPQPKVGEDKTWDEDVKSLAESLAKHAETVAESKFNAAMERLSTMQQILGHFAEDRLRQVQDQYLDSFDKRVESLGEDFKDLFGSGSGKALPRDSHELANRIRLDSVMGAIQQSRQQQGLTRLSEDEAFRRALVVEFPDRFEQSIRTKVAGQVANRQRQFTSRPTGRKTEGLTPEERASSVAESWYQTHRAGTSVPGDIPDDF